MDRQYLTMMMHIGRKNVMAEMIPRAAMAYPFCIVVS